MASHALHSVLQCHVQCAVHTAHGTAIGGKAKGCANDSLAGFLHEAENAIFPRFPYLSLVPHIHTCVMALWYSILARHCFASGSPTG